MPTPYNLPAQFTSFVGREREIAEVTRLLGGARLLTLTGTGGTGKTRLALQVASALLDDYPGGVWLVELAELDDPALIPQAAVSSLQLREEPGRDLTSTLLAYLAESKALLLLDNCEHLADGAALFADTLLRAAPRVRILATGRQPLDTPYEVAWRVPSLTMPDPRNGNLPPDKLQQYEAVRLFLERVLLKCPDFELTPQNARAVAHLCYRLDGIPLAIELAAARVNVLEVEQIVERLDERFRLLTSGHAAPLAGVARHKTLAALLDWSYDLLSEPERAMLRGLAVFAGGCTLRAVQAVCAEGADEYEVIELLSQLADKSLVVVDRQEGEARYRLLDTIRQYAWEKLEAAGEEVSCSERHLDYFLRLAESSEDDLLGERQAEWLTRIESEHDNLRAALTWGRTRAAVDGGERPLRLAGAMVWFWYFRGYLSEGRNWLNSILDFGYWVLDSNGNKQSKIQSPGALWATEIAYAKALSALGALAFLQSDYGVARARLEESLQVWRSLGDKRGAAFALMFLGRTLVRQGERWGRSLGEESVGLFREVGEKWGLALALDFLGEVQRDQGDDRQAVALHDESLELYRTMGHKWGVALELSNFGRVALRQGNYDTARAQLDEALAIEREVGDKWMVAWTLHNLGDTARFVGDYDRAVELYDESLALFRELGDKGGTARSLLAAGAVARYFGEYERAAGLYTRGLELMREVKDNTGMAAALHALGTLAHQRGNRAGATGYLTESLALCRFVGDDGLIAECLEAYGTLLAAQGDPERAATLLGAAEAARERSGTALPQSEREEHDSVLEAVRAALNAGAFEGAWRAGSSMPRERALAYALGDTVHPSPVGMSTPPAAREEAEPGEDTLPGDLTAREVEVVALIASGLTDLQVAERLIVSPRTVQAHVRSVYAKLGISTRSSLTRWALDQHVT